MKIDEIDHVAKLQHKMNHFEKNSKLTFLGSALQSGAAPNRVTPQTAALPQRGKAGPAWGPIHLGSAQTGALPLMMYFFPKLAHVPN